MRMSPPRVIEIIKRTNKPHITKINGTWCMAAGPSMCPFQMMSAANFAYKLNAPDAPPIAASTVFHTGQRGLI